MPSYRPINPKVATLESGEKHKQSFFLKRIVTFHLNGELCIRKNESRFYAHLTDRRVIIESHLHGTAKKALGYGLWAFQLITSAPGKSAGDAIKEISEADREMQSLGGYYSIWFRDIIRCEHLYQHPIGKKFNLKFEPRSSLDGNGSEVCLVLRSTSALTRASFSDVHHRYDDDEFHRENTFIFTAVDASSTLAKMQDFSHGEANEEFVASLRYEKSEWRD